MTVSVTYLKLAKLMFAGLMFAFLVSVGDANLMSAVDAKDYNLPDCTESECKTEKGVHADATDHFYQGCSVNGGTTKKPELMVCKIKNLWGDWDNCEPAASSGDQLWCSCTNANTKNVQAKVEVSCPSS